MASDTESIDDLFDADDFDSANSSIDKSNSNDLVELVNDQNLEVKAFTITKNPDTCVDESSESSGDAGVTQTLSGKPIDSSERSDGGTANHHANCEDDALSLASGESLFSDDDEGEMVCDKVEDDAKADNATCRTLQADKRAVELISCGPIPPTEQNDNVELVASGPSSLSDTKSTKKVTFTDGMRRSFSFSPLDRGREREENIGFSDGEGNIDIEEVDEREGNLR